jgi:O-acetyl-ADP-ribose deacetylase (regulator of RNase III)
LQGQQLVQFNCDRDHQELVTSVSFSPDGQSIAMGTWNGTVRLWNLDGQQRVHWNAHQRQVKGVSFRPDGQMIATVAKDELRLWDLCGQQLAQWNANQNKILRVCFSPDGQRIATAGWNGTIRLWNLSGRQLVQWNLCSGEVTSMSFSPDGKYIAVVSGDGTVWLWQVEGLNELLARGCNWLKDYFVTHPEAFMQSPAPMTLPPQRLVSVISNDLAEGFLGEFLVHDKLVKIYQGDITNLVTDVIVSSDDNYLSMGGGVSGRIRQVGGDEIYREARNLTPLSLGEVAVTTAGNLRAKKIFHSVVIDFDEAGCLSDDTIQNVIQRVVHTCLKKANRYRFKTITFPLLGTGAGGFPIKVAWETLLRQIITDLSNENQEVSEVIVALHTKEVVEELDVKSFLKRIEKIGWKIL